MDWLGIKDLTAHLGLAKDALHIYFAFCIQIAAAAALRRSLANWMPWACVLLAVGVNEVLDIELGLEARVQEWQVLGARHDILNTMLLPTLLLLLCRYAPGVFTNGARPPHIPPAQSSGEAQMEEHPRP